MSNQQKPPERREGDINFGGTVKGAQNFVIGQGGSVHITGNVSQEVGATIDLPALKSSLMELYELLGSANIPLKQRMAMQLATGRAAELAEGKELQAEVLAQQVKQMGETFQNTGEAIDAGSQLGRKILKIANIVGPLVGGGARLVAGWFGLPLL